MDVVAVNDLFRQNNIRNDIIKFRLYIHAVIARYIFDEEGKYSSYQDAWMSKRAGALKRYLPEEIWQVQEDLIFDLCDYVSDSDGIDFLTHVSSGLFPGDISELFKYLREKNGLAQRNFIYILITLYALYR